MPDKISILCVHGVGHGDLDPSLKPSWSAAIARGIQRWKPDVELEVEFLQYDDLFDHAPLNPVTYGHAFTKLLASGVFHGIGDFLPRTRGLFDLPDQIRWTAGMIAQWASEDNLRAALRSRILGALAAKPYGLVCAHSLGSLICYDTFRRNPAALAAKVFLTFGSQIANPFVRDAFAGRIEPLDARMWYHLYNPEDRVFTAEIRLEAPNFTQVFTKFDKPNDILNHDAVWYFDHANTASRVWLDVSAARYGTKVNSREVIKNFIGTSSKPCHRIRLQTFMSSAELTRLSRCRSLLRCNRVLNNSPSALRRAQDERRAA